MKHWLFFIVGLLLASNSFAYDFTDKNCFFTITSLTDLTVALSKGDSGSSYFGEFSVPSKAMYAGKEFTVTSIEDDAFNDCSFSTLTIPSTIVDAPLSGAIIGKLIIEDSNSPLGEFKVRQCNEAYVGRNSETYWPYSFSYSTIKKITFGENVTYIGDGLCEECENLEEIELSNNVRKIGNGSFSGCVKLKSIKGEGVETLDTKSFAGCIALETFDFPNLKIIENGDGQWGTYRWGVFQGCYNLKNVVLPKGVAKIGTMAFKDCASLESVSIPASVICIGDEYEIEHSSVFSNCPSLKNIAVTGTTPINIGETTFDPNTYINATLNVPTNSKNNYQTAENWKNFFNIEEDSNLNDNTFTLSINGCSESYGGFVEIAEKAIKTNNYITSVTSGESVTIRFVPADNNDYKYELHTVKINGKDFTEDVVNNELTFVIKGNTSIDIDWEERENDPVLLTIKQAENGCTKMEVNKWNTYKFYIEPSKGWKIHLITYNGKDITSSLGTDNSIKLKDIIENSTLSIVFEGENTGVTPTYDNNIKIYGNASCIVVSGASSGDEVRIYNESGTIIRNKIINSATENFYVPNNHIYIVKVSDKIFKIAI